MKVINKIKHYTRKEVADLCEVTTQTIRFWEDAGVIPSPIRLKNNWRYWSEKDVELIIEYSNKSRKERYGKVSKNQGKE